MGSRGTGTGPGRRSHTKSRKGCKTCKARHIRCDETLPHCRNCTKHDVRCDYLDNIPVSPRPDELGHKPQLSTSTSPMYHSPPAENLDYSWQFLQHSQQPSIDDTASFTSQQLFAAPSQLSQTDLHYHHHLDSVCDSMSIKGVTDLTMWTSSLPRFLNLASNNQSVMNALLSFSANHVAWTSKSTDVRQLSFEYGSLALSGLHDTIANFCKETSDAALAASIILVCQTTDWRSWSSLETGIKSVTAAMEPWKHQSVFADIIDASLHKAHEIDPRSANPDKMQILSDTISKLSQYHNSIPAGRLEHEWIGQLGDYVRRLQSSEMVLTPQQQFEQLYTLRKWTYWVPVQLLEQPDVDPTTIITLIYLYATALQIGPLYPDVGPKFFGNKVAEPLEKCVWRIDSMPIDAHSPDLGLLLQFPRQALANFRVRCESMSGLQVSPIIAPLPDMTLFAAGGAGLGNMSPFFTPLQPTNHQQDSSRRVSSVSSLLEVPGPAYTTFQQPQTPSSSSAAQHEHGFSHNVGGQWGMVPSPMFPSSEFFEALQDGVLDTNSQVDFPSNDFATTTGGFVPLEIWT